MLRDVLSAAPVYSLFARLVGATSARRRYVEGYIRPRSGDRVLDIGCGPADILDSLPQVEYCGIDQSPEYIESARARFPLRGSFRVEAVGADLIGKYAGFDLVLATGVLHHLTDEEALALFRIAKAALKPGGALVTLDGAWVQGQSRMARALLRMDRGRHVRSPAEYERLAAGVFAHVDVRVMHDLLRVPYTHVVMRCGESPGQAEAGSR
jgi:SAM-dependent methyltransferase